MITDKTALKYAKELSKYMSQKCANIDIKEIPVCSRKICLSCHYRTINLDRFINKFERED
jgi:hypothetical protein